MRLWSLWVLPPYPFPKKTDYRRYLNMLRLRKINDDEYSRAEKLAKAEGIPLETCPTCGSKHIDGEWEGDGIYRYQGEWHECDCDTQYTLRKNYLLAGIPGQYRWLNFERDFRDADVKVAIGNYIDKWDHYSRYGIGLLFSSSTLGTGKTFAATHVGKELIKRKKHVVYTRFEDMIQTAEDRPNLEDAHCLIVDEVTPPVTLKAASFYANIFESVLRYRNHASKATIVSTNMTVDDWATHYPRLASLYLPMTISVPMPGDDFRQYNFGNIALELASNGEVAPYC